MESLLTIEEAAEYLRLKPKTIRNWISMRKIPYRKIGRYIRFDRKSLELWAQRQEVAVHKVWR
ncbi:MAG: helix-turn-helix domain-containing protein [Vulcanimicrobiota bacterium]